MILLGNGKATPLLASPHRVVANRGELKTIIKTCVLRCMGMTHTVKRIMLLSLIFFLNYSTKDRRDDMCAYRLPESVFLIQLQQADEEAYKTRSIKDSLWHTP